MGRRYECHARQRAAAFYYARNVRCACVVLPRPLRRRTAETAPSRSGRLADLVHAMRPVAAFTDVLHGRRVRPAANAQAYR